MPKHFQNEIEKLKKKILHLSAMVEENLMLAVRAVTERDSDLARRVIEVDTEIDRTEVDVEEECLKILALHQPVAIDLRYVIAVLKINNDLERIGDLAVNTGKRTRRLLKFGPVPIPFDLEGMLQLTVDMVKKSTDALINSSSQMAREVCLSDDDIDDFHAANYGLLEDEIRKNPEAVDYYVSLLGISRNLERIADHATNIAEDVAYMVEGDIVRHKGARDGW
ncbi:MAG: phosphate signaling complex protein PhoU [candidate division Zixibacteria bacterium]|nr:phosphate signaling complex protein PhoU [candidate division Zixibacteria bacterium]